MTIRLSQADQPAKIPRIQELQKAFKMISDVKLPDGTYKQIIMTPRGRIIRYMDSAHDKVLKQDVRSFPVASDKSKTKIAADLWEGPDYEERQKTKQIQEQQGTRLEEMRKAIQPKMLSERQIPNDKTWYQVWQGPMGKFVKIMSPDKNKVVRQYTPQSASYKKIKKAQSDRLRAINEEMNGKPAVPEISSLDLASMPLSGLARIVKGDWKNVYFGAVPYLDAMETLKSIGDKYYEDSGSSIVAYFLSNATSWKGEVARAVKKELNKRLNASYKK